MKIPPKCVGFIALISIFNLCMCNQTNLCKVHFDWIDIKEAFVSLIIKNNRSDHENEEKKWWCKI